LNKRATVNANTTPTPRSDRFSERYLRLLKGEITPQEYVRRVDQEVRRQRNASA
jgi:hypothetical protein